jgi:hypothetical protein
MASSSASSAISSQLTTGTGDKLKKLQINKKESTSFLHKEASSSKLISILSINSANKLNNSTSKGGDTTLNNSTQSVLNNSNQVARSSVDHPVDCEEILVTIRKSERGFGFDLQSGINIVKVIPNSPAFNSGIKEGDVIVKINGTCVLSKEVNEITKMIHESNSFVSLTLRRKLSSVVPPPPTTTSTTATTGLSTSHSQEDNSLEHSTGGRNNNENVGGSRFNHSIMSTDSTNKNTLKNVTNQYNKSLSSQHQLQSKNSKKLSTSSAGEQIDLNKHNNEEGDNNSDEDDEDEHSNDEYIEYDQTNDDESRSVLINNPDIDMQPSVSVNIEMMTDDHLHNNDHRHHRKQHSMSDESFKKSRDDDTSMSAATITEDSSSKANRSRKGIKKVRVSVSFDKISIRLLINFTN